MARLGLKTAGRLSRGVSLGWRHGFDSGLSLDYVYENRAGGALGIGRLIDRSYLNAIGWRGIRERKANLGRALRSVMTRVRAEKRPLHILDIAAGPGRYVIETVASERNGSIRVTLRDYKEENVNAARLLAEKFGVPGISAELGDAFDPESLSRLDTPATIGIVSGLYELFSSNELVLRSLRGLATALSPGAYLIYTNQPWHPQVEFIARVLRNREGQPWVMRRRTTAEMDELVEAAGFEKLEMEVDEWGMFTVSVARKPG